MHIAGKIQHSFVNGPGCRYVIFFQGCPHACPGCQNPETHDGTAGEEVPVSTVISDILHTRFIDGVTLSGGDPFVQPKAIIEIADAVKKTGLTVWAYSGWTYEQLMSGDVCGAQDALKYIDVLVDGPYVASLRSESTLWRGSSNQRLVDVQKSMAAGRCVEFTPQTNIH
jgi:anaerobic ribonucleoside-triphosphate reductase activating protein